jgi:hypothetical protein
MKIISLGWGVQSFTLAAMVALGELEMVDAALHADTTHESILTYQFAKRWTGWLEEKSVKIVTVCDGDKRLGEGGVVDIPAFTISNNGNGQTKRLCTPDWKIAPMRRWLQANRNGEPVEMWLGISTDEFQRMRDSDVKYVTNRYPLIELNMSRKDCVKWLQEHNLEVPPRSACTFCPFHTTDEWRKIKKTPQDWQEAIEVDYKIRKARPPYDLFVHPSRKPLDEVDFRTLEEKGQMRLWDEECSGICGV